MATDPGSDARIIQFAAHAERRLVFQPTPDRIIDAHIRAMRHHGLDFAPWTQEAEAAFLARRNRKTA